MSAADVIQLLILLTAVAGLFFTIGAKITALTPAKCSGYSLHIQG